MTALAWRTGAHGVSANCTHLGPSDAQLFRPGSPAERCWREDQDTEPLKLPRLGASQGQQVASRCGVELRRKTSLPQLTRRLEFDGIPEREAAELFQLLRRKGNLANHALQGDHASELKTLRFAWQLGAWFHRTCEPATMRRSGVGPSSRPGPLPPATLPLKQVLQELREV